MNLVWMPRLSGGTDVLFPLTPTLSRGERENTGQPVVGAEVLTHFMHRTSWLPLPTGEGWGEGEQVVRIPALHVTMAQCKLFDSFNSLTLRHASPQTHRPNH